MGTVMDQADSQPHDIIIEWPVNCQRLQQLLNPCPPPPFLTWQTGMLFGFEKVVKLLPAALPQQYGSLGLWDRSYSQDKFNLRQACDFMSI